MTIPVGGDIGDEVHTVDQALTFTSGLGKATIAGKDQDVKAGDLMVVPAGTQHQFVNTGPTPLVSCSFKGNVTDGDEVTRRSVVEIAWLM